VKEEPVDAGELPPAPAAAREFFGERLTEAVRYGELLADAGVRRGRIGPREVPRLWERHLLNCAVLSEAVPEGVTVCDVGSGAGLPGIPLALVRPDLRITLLEPLLRRTNFLTEAAEALELDNVEVVRARAEELHGRRAFDVVTSRAVAPLPRLLRWSMPLVAPGGAMLAMKGASAADEVASATKDLKRAGVRDVGVESYGDAIVDPPTRVIRVVAGPRVSGEPRPGPQRRSTGGRKSRSE
jgi:16S rRNA (guanine527-N7)-methyltransferase